MTKLVASALAAIALSLVLGTPSAWSQPKSPVTIRAGGQEATVLADQLQQVGGANELLIAVGNVEITQGQSRLLADRVELNQDTGEAVAQGRVVFFDGQDRLVGDRVDYNLKTGTGVVYNASTFSAPYYHLSAERMDRIGPGLYNVYRGVFTTCEGDEPAWSFKMGTGTVALDDIAYGQNASFWVTDKLPLVPWVPFFAAAIRRERQSGLLFPEFGSSSKKGLFAKIPYYWAISDSQDMTISLDTYTRRGVGVEGEYRYVLSQQARGDFSGFFIREALRSDADRERLDIPENRGFFSFRHDWQILPRLSFRVDANATTDDLVFREYGDALHERARQRAETNVFVSRRWDSWSLVANVLWYQDLTTPAATESPTSSAWSVMEGCAWMPIPASSCRCRWPASSPSPPSPAGAPPSTTRARSGQLSRNTESGWRTRSRRTACGSRPRAASRPRRAPRGSFSWTGAAGSPRSSTSSSRA